MKKFLSLVLALVMTMSLVTISAGAKDFTDDSTITYSEAVDVISEIGVVDGYTDGSFNPGATLTRGAAAKIICNLILGPTTASALSADAAPYKDVPTSNTFAGYIAYCAQQGIISGYADGTFRPAGTLTSYAFMKMLLGALGYDAEIEGYVGSNWSIQVAKQALAIDLDDGLVTEFVGTKPVTREEACLYALNTLKATMVEYDAKTTVAVSGATVTIAGDKAKEVEQGSYKDNMGKANLQFAEKYFDKLKLDDSATDDFGRPSNKWTYKGVEIDTYPKTPDATYTANVKVSTIYADLGMSDKDESAPMYIDGEKVAQTVNVKKDNDCKLADLNADGTDEYKIGNGTLIECFLDDDTNDVTICCINTYVAEINKQVAATSSKDAYITLSPLGRTAADMPAKTNDEFETDEEFDADAIVLYTYADGDIQSVKVAESVDGTLTKTTVTKNVVIADTTYKFSKCYDVKYGEENLTVDGDYTVYLDEYGYAIYVEEAEYTIQDYALLQGIQGSQTNKFDTDRASLLTYEGKDKVVYTNKDYTETKNLPANFEYSDKNNGTAVAIGEEGSVIVVAKETSNGEYSLKDLTANQGTRHAKVTAKGKVLENGVASFTLNGNKVYANSKTVFVVCQPNRDAKAYTGIKNAPDITITGENQHVNVSYYCRKADMATIVYIDTNARVENGNSDVIFFSFESASKRTVDADNEYYTYTAVINGKITEGVKVDANVNIIDGATGNVSAALSGNGAFKLGNENVIFTGAEYDDGVITDLETLSGDYAVYYETGTDKLDGDYTIELGGNKYTVDEDVKVFFADDDGVVTEGSINSVKKSDDKVCFVTEDDAITYLFVQQYFDDKDNSTSSSTNTSGLTVAVVDDAITVTYAKGASRPSMAAVKTAVVEELGVSANGSSITGVGAKDGYNYSVTTSNGDVYQVKVVEADK